MEEPFMRRYWPKLLIFAIITFSLAITGAPASATPHGPAASASAASQPYRGMVCRTVHSKAHHRTGVICTGISVQGNGSHHIIRAVTSFKPADGTLISVSASHFNLYVNGGRVASGAYSTTRGHGGIVITTRPWNLWDGVIIEVRSGVFNACMYWKGGGSACTGASWLFSKDVRV
jgi:hypothetical protein